jgi:NADH:ubiquinone oxidoreductase subunit 6 (subunit J)
MTTAVFILFSLMVLGGGLIVVTASNIVHAASALILSLFGVAGLYVLLNAGFLAAVQVLVYIGAIAILIIFTVMLTRRGGEERLAFNSMWTGVLLLVILAFVGLMLILNQVWPFGMEGGAPELNLEPTEQLGRILLDPAGYVLPFEVASILLLGAMIGAIAIAREKREE